MADEVELKLELSLSAAEALQRSGVLPGAPRITRHRSVYFDTPDHQLAAAGLSLRIRTDGDNRIQTVKAGGAPAAGLFARPEWEMPVEDDRPLLDDATPVRAMLGQTADAVEPLFDVLVERRTWMIDLDGATIEVVLDRGDAVAGDRRSPVCEIELEQKSGRPEALFTLARQIDRAAPVRLGVLTKSERGYHLLAAPEEAVKAEPIQLTADIDAAQAFQHIARACLRQFRLNEMLLRGERSPAALHQARVALRRLRSAFSLFQTMLGDSRFDRLREETRWLAGTLGDARDIDVMIARNEHEDFRARLEEARARAYAAAEAALESDRARSLMLDLAEWIAVGEWLHLPQPRPLREQSARLFAAEALDRFRRKVKKQGRDLAELDDEARHEVRKAAKKLRYASEFFRALFDDKRQRRRYKRFVSALEELQDRLGALNDLVTAPSLLERIRLIDAPGAAVLIAASNKRKLLDTAADAHAALVDAKRFWR